MLVHESVGKFGAPYFDNMLPTYRGYGNGISCYQCCAYQFANTPETDPHFNEKLYFEGGQHFSMGGWQVVSLNMPRMAYRANGDYDKLLEAAQENMRMAVDVFKTKQHWMKKALANNMVPFATQTPRDPHTGQLGPPAVDFSELVNVIGVVGVNEMVQHFTGKQLHEDPDSVRLAIRLLLDMEKYRKGLEMRNGFKIMLARTPAESTAQTFAISDLVSPTYKKYAVKTVKGRLGGGSGADEGKEGPPRLLQQRYPHLRWGEDPTGDEDRHRAQVLPHTERREHLPRLARRGLLGPGGALQADAAHLQEQPDRVLQPTRRT